MHAAGFDPHQRVIRTDARQIEFLHLESQDRVYGGIKPSLYKLLARAVEETATESSKPTQPRMAQSRTILVRQWGGIIHRVRCSTTTCLSKRNTTARSPKSLLNILEPGNPSSCERLSGEREVRPRAVSAQISLPVNVIVIPAASSPGAVIVIGSGWLT